jgi:hypothetical protein
MTEFDRELDRQLQQLPALQAPVTLLPRVLTAVGQLDRSPWYSRPWVTWPRGFQVASATFALLVIAGLVIGAPLLNWISPGLADDLGRSFDPLQSLSHLAGQASTLTRVFWHVWLEPIAFYLVALLVLLALAVTAALSLVNSAVCLAADAPHAGTGVTTL